MPISAKDMQFVEFNPFTRYGHNNRQRVIRLLNDNRTTHGIPNNDGHKYKNYPYMNPIKTNKDYTEWFIGQHHTDILGLVSDGQAYTVDEVIERIGETVCKANIIVNLDFKTVRQFLNENGAKKVNKQKLEKRGLYIDNYYYIKK